MPQFDIASFYPQITFFAGLFLIFYVFLTKNILPKISQNLKLNKKINELYHVFSLKGLKDINLLGHVYGPHRLLTYLIYKESLCLVFLRKTVEKITTVHIACLNWLSKTHEKNLKIRLLKLNRTYFKILNDVYCSRHTS